MIDFKDQEQASYTAEPTAVDLSVIIDTYTALLAGDNLPERVAVQTVVLQTLLDATALSSAPSPEAVRREALEAIRDINIREEVDSYEWRGDNGDYTPNDKEKELLEDFGAGIIGLADDAIRALQTTQPQPAVKVDESRVIQLEVALTSILVEDSDKSEQQRMIDRVKARAVLEQSELMAPPAAPRLGGEGGAE